MTDLAKTIELLIKTNKETLLNRDSRLSRLRRGPAEDKILRQEQIEDCLLSIGHAEGYEKALRDVLGLINATEN